MTITLFVAPQALLMQVPLIGPLVYVPMQYAAAWLLNMLLTDAPTRPPVAGAATHSQVIPSSLTCAYCLGCSENAGHYSSTGGGVDRAPRAVWAPCALSTMFMCL